MLLRAACAETQSDAHQQVLRSALRALDVRYPLQVDAAVNRQLAGSTGRATPEPATPGRLPDEVQAAQQPRSGAAAGADGQEAAGGETAADRQLVTFLSATFGGSARQPVAGAKVTLLLGVDAPAAAVRSGALQKLDTLVTSGEADDEAAAFLRAALVRRLQDDDLGVVCTALGTRTLLHLAADPLVPSLGAVLGSMRRRSEGSKGKADRAAARNAAKKVLRLLSGPVLERHPGALEPLCCLLLDQLLVTGPRGRKLAGAVLGAARSVDHPVLQGLRSVHVPGDDAPQQQQPPKKGKKNGKKAKGAAPAAQGTAPGVAQDVPGFNQAVIEGLAVGIGGAGGGAVGRVGGLLDACGGGGRVALLSAAGQAAQPGTSNCMGLVEALFRFWQSRWKALVPALGELADRADEAPHVLLARDSAAAEAVALRGALQGALQALDPATLGAADLQRLAAMFAELAGAAEGTPLLHPLLGAVARAAGPSAGSQGAFLSQFAGLPLPAAGAARAASGQVQAAALRMLASSYAAGEAGGVAGDLPALFVALSSPLKRVRRAALEAVQALQQASAAKSYDTGDASLPTPVLLQLLVGLGHCRQPITADGDALQLLLSRALALLDATPAKAPGPGLTSPAHGGRARSSGRGGGKAGAKRADAQEGEQGEQGGSAAEGRLPLDEGAAHTVRGWLLSALPGLHPGEHRHMAAGLALRLLSGQGHTSNAAELLKASAKLLDKLLGERVAPGAALSPLEAQLATQLLGSFSADAVEALAHQHHEFAAALGTLERVLWQPQDGDHALEGGVVVAALRQVGPELYSHLTEGRRSALLAALLRLQATGGTQAVQQGARASLAALPLAACTLVPLLEGVVTEDADQGEAGGRKRARREAQGRAGGAGTDDVTEAGGAGGSGGFDVRAAVLELLQWREGIEQEADLVGPLQALVEGQTLGGAGDAHAQPQQLAEARSAQDSYCQGLALGALALIAKRCSSKVALRRFNVGLAVDAARSAPDGAVRNAALRLLGALAARLPERTLQHVLEVVGIVSDAAPLVEDTYSRGLLSTTLAACVPPWLAAGRSAGELVGALLQQLPSVAAHSRLALMGHLVDALPEDTGLSTAVTQLLQQAAASPPPSAAAAPPGDGTIFDRDWLLDLATSLAARAPPARRCAALGAVIGSCLEAAGGAPHRPLAALAVAFATQQLQGLGPGAAARLAGEERRGLQHSLEQVMRQLLSQLQVLGRAQGGCRAAVGTATEGCYVCLDALEGVMEAAEYLRALVELAQHESDSVQGRALKLFANKVRQLASEAADADDVAGDEEGAQGGVHAGGRGAVRQAEIVSTALSMCAHVASIAAPGSGAAALTQQQALVAVGMLAQWLGAGNPGEFLALVPGVLGLLAPGAAPCPVRASALACLASMSRSLGLHLVPALPRLVPAAISCTQRALADVALAQAAAAASHDDTSSADDSDSLSSGGGDVAAKPGDSEEDLSLELAAGLACKLALVQSPVGPFLSPYLPALLQLLLSGAVLRCRVAGVAQVAAQVREKLPDKVPVRLLLPALLGHLETAVQEGPDSVVEHMQLLANTVAAMDRTAVAAHHEAVLQCLLQGLDLRRQRPATLAQQVPRVEEAVTRALVALTMKLNEARFKPMFLRLMEWAATAHEDDPGALSRCAALYRVVGALTERLRGIFLPYFRYLLDSMPALLSTSPDQPLGAGAHDSAAKKSKKARRASSSAAQAAAAEAGSAVEGAAWVVRLHVLRALHRCFLYDSGGQVEEGRFSRLLPHVVAQLDAQPPAHVQHALMGDPGAGLDAELALGTLSDAEVDAQHGLVDGYAKAVIGCLSAMVVAAGSDALWKPLNHQVLMQTRSPLPRTRLCALEAVAQFVVRLREEYLVLLPEALPFLAELVEDVEVGVQERAKQLLRQLEELSGESLEQYLQA